MKEKPHSAGSYSGPLASTNPNTPYNAQNPAPQPDQGAKVFLPGQDPSTPLTYSDHTIPLTRISAPYDATIYPSSGHLPPLQDSTLGATGQPPITPFYAPEKLRPRRSSAFGMWLLALIAGIFVIGLVFGLLLDPIAAAGLQKIITGNTTGKTASQQAATASTPAVPTPATVPTQVPTPVPTPAGAAVNGVTVSPAQLDMQRDCQLDNGYRCTLTLTLAPQASNTVSWSASVDGVDSQLHPHRGKLDPGQQQQIIMNVDDGACPFDASFNVTVQHQQVSIPLHCGGQ
jgi:hypothetical protein